MLHGRQEWDWAKYRVQTGQCHRMDGRQFFGLPNELGELCLRHIVIRARRTNPLGVASDIRLDRSSSSLLALASLVAFSDLSRSTSQKAVRSAAVGLSLSRKRVWIMKSVLTNLRKSLAVISAAGMLIPNPAWAHGPSHNSSTPGNSGHKSSS